ADGDSLRYYPAYDLPGRARLAPQVPVAARTKAQLLLAQRLDGGLTIGDTHEYSEPFAFDVDEDAYDHLRGRAEALLGTALPRVRGGGQRQVRAGRPDPALGGAPGGAPRPGPGRAGDALGAGNRRGAVHRAGPASPTRPVRPARPTRPRRHRRGELMELITIA